MQFLGQRVPNFHPFLSTISRFQNIAHFGIFQLKVTLRRSDTTLRQTRCRPGGGAFGTARLFPPCTNEAGKRPRGTTGISQILTGNVSAKNIAIV